MISEKRIESCVKILCAKAQESKSFAKRIDESVRRMFDYKISQGYLKTVLQQDGTYRVVICYPEFKNNQAYDQFESVKAQNISLYQEKF